MYLNINECFFVRVLFFIYQIISYLKKGPNLVELCSESNKKESLIGFLLT